MRKMILARAIKHPDSTAIVLSAFPFCLFQFVFLLRVDNLSRTSYYNRISRHIPCDNCSNRSIIFNSYSNKFLGHGIRVICEYNSWAYEYIITYYCKGRYVNTSFYSCILAYLYAPVYVSQRAYHNVITQLCAIPHIRKMPDLDILSHLDILAYEILDHFRSFLYCFLSFKAQR